MTHYGFTIIRYGPGVRRGNPGEGWLVTLPHQCDEWEISHVDEPYDPDASVYPPPHDKAVAYLEEFIAEAQQALADLKAKRPTESIDL